MGKEKKRIVLIVGGGIAAYKSLDLTRHLMRAGFSVDCLMTKSATAFVQPLSFAALSGNRVRQDLFDEDDEAEMGHIALSRRADLILVAPATANLLSKMAAGFADDFATTLLLANHAPVLCAPAMNWRMWAHPATKRNVAQLKADGVSIIEPDVGSMACGEFGAGRLPDTEAIAQKAVALIAANKNNEGKQPQPLNGKKFLLTSGATREALDPVRFISNYSSGKQGTALAESLAEAGGEVFFVEGASTQAAPQGNKIHHFKIEKAQEMKEACDAVLTSHKIDAALCVAAVCDWRPVAAAQKIKKTNSQPPPLTWIENPDILADIAQRTAAAGRPSLVIGFAAETENVLANARAKRQKKQCDWIIANDVSENCFGADENEATIIRESAELPIARCAKKELAQKITDEIAAHFATSPIVQPL